MTVVRARDAVAVAVAIAAPTVAAAAIIVDIASEGGNYTRTASNCSTLYGWRKLGEAMAKQV